MTAKSNGFENIVVINQLGDWGAQDLQSRYPGVRVVSLGTDLNSIEKDARVVFWTHGGLVKGADRTRWLAAVERAEWVHFVPVGIDGVLADAHEVTRVLSGRLVSCGRGVNTPAIAEFVIALILAAEKRLPAAWAGTTTGVLGTLVGRTVGLIGLGSINQAVAQRLVPFEVKLVGYRRRHGGEPIPHVEISASLDDVLAACDHLVLALPLTASTERLFDRKAFGKIKKGAHLVNVARGRIVDHDALLDALTDGTLSRASIDVSDPDPLPSDHPLRHREDVYYTNHLAAPSQLSRDRMVERFYGNLERWLAGKELAGVVDLEAGY